jgi:4'-phosphopantetheinyl transferase
LIQPISDLNMSHSENRIKEFVFVQPDQVDWKLGNEVHVWKFPAIPSDFSELNDQEKIVAERFRFEGDRNRYVTGRKSLRNLLAKYHSVDMSDIHIIGEKGQKPQVISPNSTIRFNISHSGEWVVIALAQEELGIDIEWIDSAFDYSNILMEHFGMAERQFISSAENPLSAFYFLWTRKEALAKAEGSGLPENLSWVSVLGRDSISGSNKKKWNIKSFNLSPDYPVSLVYSDSLREIFYFDGSHLFTGIRRQ